MAAWIRLYDPARPAFAQQRTFERARTLRLSALASLGRRTVSGLLCTAGQQQVLGALPPEIPVVAQLDDTLIRKRGRHIAGTSWLRDPLGPPFADNFIWASRFLQISPAVPQHLQRIASPARPVPVDLQYAPSPRKPSRRASAEQWQACRQAAAASNISSRGAERVVQLRRSLDQQPDGEPRHLLACADATFTCRAVLRNLPARRTLIGRIRKDARLYALPTAEQENLGRGRRRCYGRLLPTPEQHRQDEAIPRQPVRAFAAGNYPHFEIKTIGPVRWKHAGGDRQLRLLIVRPIAYRLRKGGVLNYRQPAYLICTDPTLSPQRILQAYLWRWEIGVSSQGHIVQSVKDRPRLKDSGLVAGEALWRESKTAEPSDNILRKECAQRTRLQRAVNADVASLHESPVAETVDNARKQQGLAETSPMRQFSPAG